MWLILGSPPLGSRAIAVADATWLNESNGDLLGYDVEGGGDVDADGFADVVFGAPGHDGDRGVV